MAIQVAGEGWIGDLYDWFPAPQWMQVYDRRSAPQIPVGLPPGGGTQPIIADPSPAQIPAVVPGPTPTFNIPVLPPTILNGLPDVPSGSVGESNGNGEETVALHDEPWWQTAIDIANVWGQTRSPTFAYGGQQPVALPPTITSPAPGQMGDNGHWVPAGCKRRKRQRNILTQANIGIMWQISSLPNNANVRIALARAIR